MKEVHSGTQSLSYSLPFYSLNFLMRISSLIEQKTN